MRITPSITAENALYNLQQGRSKLDAIQEQIASGVKINRPSEDPITTRQLIDLNERLVQGDQYKSNITKAKVWINLSATALNGMNDTFNLIKKVAGTVASGSGDATTSTAAVSQLQEFKKTLIDYANTQSGSQYVFGGFNSSTQPFSLNSNNYSGTTDAVNIDIANNSKVQLNSTGDQLLTNVGASNINVLNEIDNLVTAIQTPPSGNLAAIQSATGNIEKAADEMKNTISAVSGHLLRLENAQNFINSDQATINNMMSNVQGVDLTKAAVELSQQQTAFSAALSATAKISQLSLLDYL